MHAPTCVWLPRVCVSPCRRFDLWRHATEAAPIGEPTTAERRVLLGALEQIALADRLGIEYVWAVEHHFLEAKEHIPDNAGRGGLGNPAQVRERLECYERAAQGSPQADPRWHDSGGDPRPLRAVVKHRANRSHHGADAPGPLSRLPPTI
jgi:hypothetical protein